MFESDPFFHSSDVPEVPDASKQVGRPNEAGNPLALTESTSILCKCLIVIIFNVFIQIRL